MLLLLAKGTPLQNLLRSVLNTNILPFKLQWPLHPRQTPPSGCLTISTNATLKPPTIVAAKANAVQNAVQVCSLVSISLESTRDSFSFIVSRSAESDISPHRSVRMDLSLMMKVLSKRTNGFDCDA